MTAACTKQFFEAENEKGTDSVPFFMYDVHTCILC